MAACSGKDVTQKARGRQLVFFLFFRHYAVAQINRKRNYLRGYKETSAILEEKNNSAEHWDINEIIQKKKNCVLNLGKVSWTSKAWVPSGEKWIMALELFMYPLCTRTPCQSAAGEKPINNFYSLFTLLFTAASSSSPFPFFLIMFSVDYSQFVLLWHLLKHYSLPLHLSPSPPD